MYGGIKVYLHASLISALDMCEWSLSYSDHINPRERAHDTYWIEACVFLDVVVLDNFILIRYPSISYIGIIID